MKQRYSSLDVKVIAHELSSSLCSLRVANIYDLSTRIFLFKFQKPNRREQLLVDSGFRCHLTSFARATAAAPSPFVVRLRKFLKTRRVTSISQVGTDRIIEFQFSDGLYRLYLEFYAGGNVILTDNELNILSLLRSVDEGAEHERVKVGIKYNLTERQNYGGVPELTKERVREGLQKAIERQQEATDKKSKKKGKDALRKALAVSITELPPMLVDHAFHSTGFDPSVKPEQVLEDDSLLDNLMKALEEAKKVGAEITTAEVAKGYIVAKRQPGTKGTAEEGGQEQAPAEKLLYEDFHPFNPKQFEADPSLTFLEFEGFNKTVDEFFSSIEGQKLESRLQEREENAKRKLEQAKKEHEKRLGGLQQAQELNIRKAEAIQANVDRVQEATMAVNGLIEKGMDWVEIGHLIERERKQGNPVAEMIKPPLKLHENTVTLLLAEPGVQEDDEDFEGSETESESSEDEDEQQQQQQRKKPAAKPEDTRLTIDIDLGLTPWANAKIYFDQKKTAAAKEERTLEASQKALKSTQKKIEADLKKGLKQEKELLRPVRKQFWFEKFMYFISSDGYLVLGGKDAQQNEILYRRYLKKGDIYVHADLNGAASVIIKNNPSTPDAPIPPSTLSQAGNLAVSTSTAWDSKAVMSAWWVNADQVSKTAPNGEYLTTGGFIINGKKNFLPPAQLLLGFAIIFQITEESKKNHMKHRLADSNVPPKSAAPQPSVQEEEKPKEEAVEQDDDSDSDEDFPDAKLGSASDESEDERHERSNPLQSGEEEEEPQEEQNPAQEEDPKDEEQAPESSKAADQQNQPEPKQEKQEKSGGKRHLSARERRLLRKGVNPSELPTGSTYDSDDEGDTASVAPTEATTQNSGQKQKQTPLPRGKRGKAKKIAQKYAEQDEEERELALRLLGAKAAGKDAAEPEQPKPSKEEELQAQKQRRREQHQRAQEKGKADEERRRAALEGALGEDVDPAVDEETARLLEQIGIDAFTGRPLPGDELVAAIPVCAPWSALAAYKYKVKLQPGATKKGKAVKEILGRWDAAFKEPRAFDRESRDVERIWPREAELVKAWKETEVYGVVPVGKVRVMLSGGHGGGGSGGGGGDKNRGKKSARGGKGSKRK
ncbi:Ribosome quality control complex subunit 2 [Neofusicoccum parvum]|nr:Ribosome quality control complex subunit 2 [Neofusicoccum parvum]